MSLESGTYIITSKFGYNLPVGPDLMRDQPGLLRRVFVLFRGVEAPKWDIQKLPNGNYHLKTGGRYAANINGLLFVGEEPVATEWRLQRDERSGAYAITEAVGREEGWIVYEKQPYTQIAVRFSGVGPFYPPNQVFDIMPAN